MCVVLKVHKSILAPHWEETRAYSVSGATSEFARGVHVVGVQVVCKRLKA